MITRNFIFIILMLVASVYTPAREACECNDPLNVIGKIQTKLDRTELDSVSFFIQRKLSNTYECAVLKSLLTIQTHILNNEFAVADSMLATLQTPLFRNKCTFFRCHYYYCSIQFHILVW